MAQRRQRLDPLADTVSYDEHRQQGEETAVNIGDQTHLRSLPQFRKNPCDFALFGWKPKLSHRGQIRVHYQGRNIAGNYVWYIV